MPEKRVYKEIGVNIMRIRSKKGLSRAVLAGLAGISPTFLYEIETGRKGFSVVVLLCLAEALGVEVSELLYGEKSKDYSKKIEKIIEKYDPDRINDFVELLKKIQIIIGEM